ncbi:MAG: glutamate-5-semialdehyde dehydrogenase, partial [Parvularculaceae bacterium]
MATDLIAKLDQMGVQARAAARILALASTEAKTQALLGAADAVKANQSDILAANKKDLAAGKTKGLTPALLDRLMLDPARLDAIAQSLRDIAALPDPVGETITSLSRPNGLAISRVRVPIGVLGIIYESRPNVTIDAGALCLKSGNGVILRGGSESLHSSIALHACLITGLRLAGLPEHAIQLVPTSDRAAVGAMLTGLNGTIDVIIPRGGKSLIERVSAEASIPIIKHLDGLCHVYVDDGADLSKAFDIAINSKTRRYGVCNAMETLLVADSVAKDFLPRLIKALIEKEVE